MFLKLKELEMDKTKMMMIVNSPRDKFMCMCTWMTAVSIILVRVLLSSLNL